MNWRVGRLLLGLAMVMTLWQPVAHSAEPGLAELARPHGVAIGALVELTPLQSDPAYRQITRDIVDPVQARIAIPAVDWIVKVKAGQRK